MTWVALGTEDELSESIGKRLLSEAGTHLDPWPFLRRGGSGYLRSKMKSWRELSNQQCVVLLTDLDNATCAVELLNDWHGADPRPPNLHIRVAVREVESWLLADHQGMRSLLGKPAPLPADPDSLADPKEFFLGLVAKYASKAVKEDLLVRRGAVASQGLGYNALLSSFAFDTWNPERAAARSASLRRTRTRLQKIAKELQ